MVTSVLVRASHGGKVEIEMGQILDIVNVEGHQICDLFAFNRENFKEFLSPAHCRSVLQRVVLKVGDKLVSVHRRPMFEILEDTVCKTTFVHPPAILSVIRMTMRSTTTVVAE